MFQLPDDRTHGNSVAWDSGDSSKRAHTGFLRYLGLIWSHRQHPHAVGMGPCPNITHTDDCFDPECLYTMWKTPMGTALFLHPKQIISVNGYGNPLYHPR